MTNEELVMKHFTISLIINHLMFYLRSCLAQIRVYEIGVRGRKSDVFMGMVLPLKPTLHESMSSFYQRILKSLYLRAGHAKWVCKR